MESNLVKTQRVLTKNKWVYSAHSLFSYEVEQTLNTTGYEVRRLGSLVDEIADGLHGVRNYVDSGIPMLAVGNITEYGLRFANKRMITPIEHERLKRSQVQPGDLLVTITGRLGTTIVYESSDLANLSAHVARVKVKNGVANPYYIAAYLNSPFGKQLIEEFSIGSIYAHINVNKLAQVRVVLPPQEIQDYAAQIMRVAYAAYNQKITEAGSLLEGIENCVLNHLNLSSEWPEDSRSFKVKQSLLKRADVRYFSPVFTYLEEVIEKGKYKTKYLHELCETISNGLTPAKLGYADEGYTVIKVASLTSDWQIDWKKVAFTTEAFYNKAKKAHVQEGDILLLSASHQLDYIGRSFALIGHVPSEHQQRAFIVGELIKIRVKADLILPEYLLACLTLQPVQALINRMTRGQSAHLYAEDLKELRIPVPPLEIQKAIADDLYRRRNNAKTLRVAANTIIAEAKAKLERLILGQDTV